MVPVDIPLCELEDAVTAIPRCYRCGTALEYVRLCNECQQAQENPERHSPEKLVEILHSVERIVPSEADVDFWFQGGISAEGMSSFVPGSFTRKLLELIAEHLK